MKEALRELLRTWVKNGSEDMLDDLANDLQAVIDRSLGTAKDDQLLELENRVEDVYVSDFGVHLFNLLTLEDFPGKRPLYFSARKTLTKAVIQALLLEQEHFSDRDEPQYQPCGTTLKRRLRELV